MFAALDDKWMFAREMFADVARHAGLRYSIFQNTGKSENASFMRQRVVDLIRLGLGEAFNVPDWLETMLQDLDRLISPDLQEEVLFEGCIVFHR